MLSPSLPDPEPFLIALSILSAGIFASFAICTAILNLKFISISPPPIFAATMISFDNFVNNLPLLASVAAFLCLIVDHLECPDILFTSLNFRHFNIYEKQILEIVCIHD